MKKITVCLVMMFITVSYQYADSEEENFKPMFYDNGWKEIDSAEIDKKMNETVININTGDPFSINMLGISNKKETTVSTPMQYLEAVRNGAFFGSLTTYDIIDEGNFKSVAKPLIYLDNAKVSQYSYIRNFSFITGDPLTTLPPIFSNYSGSDQMEALEHAEEQHKSWRDIAPKARILEAKEGVLEIYDTFQEDLYSEPEDERYHGGQASNIISTSIMGDFNGDGYEDIVLDCAYYYVGGSGRYYYFVVLTRKSENEVFTDITGEVDRKIFGN